MSARRVPLQLTSKARRDITEILAYTERVWGKEQKRRYRGVLSDALGRLRDHPDVGEAIDESLPGCRMLLAGQHLIFYRRSDLSGIVVLRVVHSRQYVVASSLFES